MTKNPTVQRAATYARKSTEQDGPAEARSVFVQREEGTQYARRQGWTVVGSYEDDGVSGALFDARPGLQQLLQDAALRAFDVVVVRDVSRLGRNTELTRELLRALHNQSVRVWQYATGTFVDIDTLQGGILSDIETRFAQWYRENLRAAIKPGMLKWAAGENWARRTFGYRIVVDRPGVSHMEIDADEAKVVVRIHEEYARGKSPYGIVRDLIADGVRSPRDRRWRMETVRGILARSIYRGVLTFNKTESRWGREIGDGRREGHKMVALPKDRWVAIPKPQLRLISEELEARVETRRRTLQRLRETAEPGTAPHKTPPRWMLTGLLICPDCFKPMRVRGRKNGKHGFYMCVSRVRAFTNCANRLRLPAKEIEDVILASVTSLALSPWLIDHTIGREHDEPLQDAQALTQRERDLRARIDRLVEAIASGTISASDAKDQVAETKAQLEAVQRAQVTTKRPTRVAPLREALLRRVADWRERLASEPAVVRTLLMELIGPITLHPVEPEFVLLERPGKGTLRATPSGEAEILWDAAFKSAALSEGLLLGPSVDLRASLP